MNSKQDHGSHLFLVRFWSEGAQQAQDSRDEKEWRGMVQHVLSGEARSFRDWPTLIDMLLEMADADDIETKEHGEMTKEAIQ